MVATSGQRQGLGARFFRQEARWSTLTLAMQAEDSSDHRLPGGSVIGSHGKVAMISMTSSLRYPL